MSGLTFQDDLHVFSKRGGNTINFQAVRQDATTPIGYSAWMSAEDRYIIMKNNRTDIANIEMKYYYGQ